ncbi:hypothetical protein ANCCEY_05958 [Ancylostoma ceylanicum]|uniref:Uncharacterized protein n=1 Tax=Ancylostoma ceylanicum TaxID=53326 RepID=A0A0D6LXW5_9BILA|nr:hypothetical protein ANCCEY_05958 [Ancylostoma ceylanicum]
MILWYLTLSTFFLSSSFIAYAWITLKRKDHQGLDGLVARKRSLLETVKETETFKVAKEILEKYDQESPKSLSQPSSPTTEKRPTGNRRGQPARVDQHETTLPHMDSDQPGADGTNRPPVKTLYTKSFESIPSVEVGPMRAVPARSRLKPIRPFQRESTTIVDKMVDYFFGDGPSQRPSHISTTPLPSTPRSLKPNVALDAHKISNSSLEQANDEQEKLNNRERKDDSFDDLSGEDVPFETTSH